MSLAGLYDPALTLPNLMLLSAVAAIPFFTAFASANPMMRVPIVGYSAWLFVTALANRRLQAVATRPPIVAPDAPPAAVAQVRLRGPAVVLGAATAMVVSLIVPVVGQVALTSIPGCRTLLQRRATSGTPAPSRVSGGAPTPRRVSGGTPTTS